MNFNTIFTPKEIKTFQIVVDENLQKSVATDEDTRALVKVAYEQVFQGVKNKGNTYQSSETFKAALNEARIIKNIMQHPKDYISDKNSDKLKAFPLFIKEYVMSKVPIFKELQIVNKETHTSSRKRKTTQSKNIQDETEIQISIKRRRPFSKAEELNTSKQGIDETKTHHTSSNIKNTPHINDFNQLKNLFAKDSVKYEDSVKQNLSREELIQHSALIKENYLSKTDILQLSVGELLQLSDPDALDFYEIALEDNANRPLSIEMIKDLHQNYIIPLKEEALERIKSIPSADLASLLQKLPESLRNDRDIVYEILDRRGEVWEFVPPHFKNSKEFALLAVETDENLVKKLPVHLNEDPDVFRIALMRDGKLLKYAPESIKNNKDVVLEAVRKDGRALRYASETLKNNEQVVSEAVQQNGLALQYASPALQNNRDIVVSAVKQNGLAIQYASLSLQKDTEVFNAAANQTEWNATFRALVDNLDFFNR